MKRIFISIMLLALLIPSIALAAVFKTDQNLEANETIDGNAYVVGGEISASGRVNGDLYMAGGKIMATGDNAVVRGDLVIAGGEILSDTKVGGDVLIAGGNVVFTGSSGGDVRIMAGSTTLEGTIDGELLINGGEVRIGPNTTIKGEVVINAGSAEIDPAAKLLGGQQINVGDKEAGDKVREKKAEVERYVSAGYWVARLMSILTLLVVAVIFFSVFPKMVGRLVKQSQMKEGFWKSFGLGILLLIVIPIAAVISFITGIGVLLGFVILGYMAVMLMLSVAMAGVIFGGFLNKLLGKSKKPQVNWGWLIGGVAVLHLVSQVPFVGWIIGFVFVLFAWGNIARIQWALIRKA